MLRGTTSSGGRPHDARSASSRSIPTVVSTTREISSYITIEDVRQLIVDGEEFEVRDAKTGEDLTRCVLLQIIAEHEQDGEPMLSTQLLSQIIRFYGDSLQGFMGNYLERSMQMFLEQQQQFRQQMSGLIGQTPWTMLNQLTERNLEMWKDFQNAWSAAWAALPRPAPRRPGTTPNPRKRTSPRPDPAPTRTPRL